MPWVVCVCTVPVCVHVTWCCCFPLLQANFTGQNKIVSGLLMVFNGALTAIAAYLVGWGIESAVSAEATLC